MKRKHWIKKRLHAALHFLERAWKRNNHFPEFEADCLQLNNLIEEKNFDKASIFADRVDAFLKEHDKKSPLWYLGELVLTLLVALLAAGVIRQTWFELYEIPTGSMRDTFKERDRVLVSKSIFGLNVPFQTSHFSFSTDRVQRGNIVVVTTDGLDLPDTDTKYFGVFPGKKRYVKRLVALPGDYIYFYGGDLFCLAKDEKTLVRLKQIPTLEGREFIPFISSFEGRVEMVANPISQEKTLYLKHMNKTIGKIMLTPDGTAESKIAYKDSFVREFSPLLTQNNAPRTIGEFYGIKNYALCRMLLPEELPREARRIGVSDPNAVAWLEIRHSPTLPPKRPAQQAFSSFVSTSTTWIPLHSDHLDRLASGLYTARLVIKDNRMHRYYFEETSKTEIPLDKAIPSGIYEFYHGKAFEIGFGGTSFTLPKNHPIYPKTTREFALLFNCGIDVSSESYSSTSWKMPIRFAYYRDGSLIVMGVEVFPKEDETLKTFEQKEMARQAKDFSYFAFLDNGSPDKDPLGVQFFKNYGFRVPEDHYLLLGDNPAMSLDCRYFGPVPEENIQGSPIFILWPFGQRWGTPPQPRLAWSPYSIALAALALLITLAIVSYQREKRRKILHTLQK